MLRGPFVHHNRRTKLSELSSWEIDSLIYQYLGRPKTNVRNPLHPPTPQPPTLQPPPPPPPPLPPSHLRPPPPPGIPRAFDTWHLTSRIAVGVGLGYLTAGPWSLEHLTPTAAECRKCECGPWNYALLLSEVTDVERFTLERARGRGAGREVRRSGGMLTWGIHHSAFPPFPLSPPSSPCALPCYVVAAGRTSEISHWGKRRYFPESNKTHHCVTIHRIPEVRRRGHECVSEVQASKRAINERRARHYNHVYGVSLDLRIFWQIRFISTGHTIETRMFGDWPEEFN